jgi:hypothetical protein
MTWALRPGMPGNEAMRVNRLFIIGMISREWWEAFLLSDAIFP